MSIQKVPNSSEWLKYIPISNSIDLPLLKKSNRLRIKNYPDATYFGEIEGGLRHGQGIMSYINSRLYEGSWKEDLRHGKGYEKFLNNNTFEGFFIKGKPNGNGIYKWNTGEFYDGEWCNGVKSGDGVFKGPNTESYIGEWKNSRPDGYGIYYWPSGDVYEGDFKNGLKHGHGCDHFSNGDILICEYRFGQPYGFGEYFWKNGGSYKGLFSDGMKEGMGQLKSSDNNNIINDYEGQFHRDLKEGFGIYKWRNGNIYKGFFRNDERDGLGEMRWNDGAYYLGEWVRGTKHGIGRMIYPDGTTQEGRFDHNVYVGKVQKRQYPQELLDKNFNIETLKPKDFALNQKFTTPMNPVNLLSKNRTKKLRKNDSFSNISRIFQNPSKGDNRDLSNDIRYPIFDKSSKKAPNPFQNKYKIRRKKKKMNNYANNTNSCQNLPFNPLKSRRSLKLQYSTTFKPWIPSGFCHIFSPKAA